MVVLLDAHAEGDAEGLFLHKHGGAGVTLLFSTVEVHRIAGQVKSHLLGLHLGLLQGQDVRLLYLNEVQKTLGETGSKAIHIP